MQHSDEWLDFSKEKNEYRNHRILLVLQGAAVAMVGSTIVSGVAAAVNFCFSRYHDGGNWTTYFLVSFVGSYATFATGVLFEKYTKPTIAMGEDDDPKGKAMEEFRESILDLSNITLGAVGIIGMMRLFVRCCTNDVVTVDRFDMATLYVIAFKGLLFGA